MSSEFIVFHSMTSRFRDIRLSKLDMHWMTLDWPWNNIKNTLYTLNIYLLGQMFSQFRFTTSLFLPEKGCQHFGNTGWSQYHNDFKIVTVKSTFYTLNTYPWVPNFRVFHCMTSRFQDIRLSNIGYVLNDLTLTMSTELLKVPCINWILPARPKIWSISHYGNFFLS